MDETLKNENFNILTIGSITVTLINEMIQKINDELNITFKSDEDMSVILNEFKGSTSITYETDIYEGYTDVVKFGFEINNEGIKTYRIAMRQPKKELELSTEQEQAIQFAVDNMDDSIALNCISIFPLWNSDGIGYKKGNRVQYEGKLYKVLQDHTSQSDWLPTTATSLYVEVADTSIEYPEFVQPTGSHDAYNTGDKITFEGKKYVSLIDANVYSPTDYPAGWQLVE